MVWKFLVPVFVLLYMQVKPNEGTFVSSDDCKFYYRFYYFYESGKYQLPGYIPSWKLTPYYCQSLREYWLYWSYFFYQCKYQTTPAPTPPGPTLTPTAAPTTAPPTPAPTPSPCGCSNPPTDRHFTFVGRVDNPSFVPVVVPTGYVSALVTNTQNCEGTTEPNHGQQIRINTPARFDGCPDAFDSLVAGQTYTFYGTFVHLAPDNRRSYVINTCATPCRVAPTACPATYPPTPCQP